MTAEVGKTYEKTTSDGKMSPGLSVAIATPWSWKDVFEIKNTILFGNLFGVNK